MKQIRASSGPGRISWFINKTNSLRRAPCQSPNNAARLWVILILEQCLQNKALEWFKFIEVVCIYDQIIRFTAPCVARTLPTDLPMFA